MISFIKAYWKTLLFFTLVGLFGGFFTGLYLLESYPEEIEAQLLSEMAASGLPAALAKPILGVVTALQSALYGALLGAFGIFLGKKTGLWRDERALSKKPLLLTLALSLLSGLLMILPDMLLFSHYSDAIRLSYASKPTLVNVLASVTYGAVIEEVMLRLFCMSLVAFLLVKLFAKGEAQPSVKHLMLANVISSLLFALGHLPATALLIGITPMSVLRCLLLNGGLGLIFGCLYRKCGLRYAMLAHGGCHIVSKLIWILFL